MTAEEIRALYEYNAWANQRSLDACVSLSDEQFTRVLGGSFPSVRDTLGHIMGAEWVWLERWHGRSPSTLPSALDIGSLDELRARWNDVNRGLMEFVAKLTASDLTRDIAYTNFKGQQFTYPLGSMLQHVVNHGTYHRGQVTNMLRMLDVKPRSTDLLRYLDALAGQLAD
jgi:uncharacterized damage-inducible protein DinB